MLQKVTNHVGKVNERVINRHDLNSLLQCHSHHQATNAAKSATDQTRQSQIAHFAPGAQFGAIVSDK